MAALLALHAGLSTWSAWQECAAHDEGIHLAAGIDAWRTGEHRISPEHPPLLRLIAALPLVISGARFDADDSRVREGDQAQAGAALLYEWNDEHAVLRPARLALLALTILGGIVVALVGGWLYGASAAVLAAALFALSPEFLAHGHYVATDAGVAVLLFAATAAWWAVRAKPTAVRFAAASVLSGFAIASKFSALLLPAWILPLFFADVVRSEPGDRRRVLVLTIAGAATASAIALFVTSAIYGFHLRDFLSGAALRASTLDRSWVYLLGEGSDRGFFSYFTVSFSVKTPLALVALLGIAGFLAAARSKGAGAQREIALLLPVLIFWIAAVVSRFNVGHRHLLPIYPFLFVFAAKVVEGHRLSRATWRGPVAAIAFTLYAASVLRSAPHFLSYMNEAAGGPAAAPRVFADSSVDWGQDLPSLKRWMDDFRVRRVRLGYIGAGSPSYEGIACDLLPGRGRPMTPTRDVPAEHAFAPIRDGEWIAVNLVCLHAARNGIEREFWHFLDDRRPDVRPVGSFLLFHVDPDLAERGNASLAKLAGDRLRRR
ncbi:MAG: hypothetical protein HYR85_12815 [Planctomycetes bacterium]|nr:hypothetical protein [Planctomycetota bacterium]